MEVKEWKWQRQHILMLISLLGGIFGIDRFYQRQVGWGVLKMITFGGALIWYLIDAAQYAYSAGKTEQS